MNLIKLGNEYSIITEEYTKLEAGQEIKSKSELRKRILFPKIEKDTTTLRNLQTIIDSFIKYEKVGSGHKIRITAIEPPQVADEIIQKHFLASKSTTSRQNYACNRKPLLDSLIFSNENQIQYLTSSKIIRNCTVFQEFYYEYCAIHYDKFHSSKEEVHDLDEFVKDYEISNKDYLINIMDILNEILYNTVFDKDNIDTWAKKHPVTVEKVLFQNSRELDEETNDFIYYSYFQPLIEKGVPAKHRTKLANRNYMNDHKLSYHNHDFFYYTFKFEIKEAVALKIDNEEVNHNKNEISRKVIEKLISKAVDPKGGNYHAKNASNFQEIIERIKK